MSVMESGVCPNCGLILAEWVGQCFCGYSGEPMDEEVYFTMIEDMKKNPIDLETMKEKHIEQDSSQTIPTMPMMRALCNEPRRLTSKKIKQILYIDLT